MTHIEKQRFKNKVVLISGSSSGIGKEAAISFVKQGAKVILASRNKDANEALVEEMKKQGGQAIFVLASLIYSNSKLGYFKATSVVDCGPGLSKSRAKEKRIVFSKGLRTLEVENK